MNYGKNEIDRKIKILNSSNGKVFNKIKLNLKIIIVVVIFTAVLCTAFSIAGIVKGLADSAPKISEENIIPDGYPSTIYDANGNKVQTLMGSNANRVYKKIEDIPECVQNAFVAIEDARFYKHSGVDLQGILRAVYSSLSEDKMTQGASTITQQLLKNQIFGGGNEKSFFGKLSRKIQEQCLAIRLENNIGKKKILEYYLNTINLGQNTMGVETASRRYFNKSVSKLTVSEAAVLAGITQNPTEYNPITEQANNEAKRKIVLKNMLDQGYITEDEYEDALGDDVYSRIKNVNEQKSLDKSTINSYYVDAVIDNVISDLKQKLGYTETQAYNAIYREGLKIYTCQDRELQEICDSVINDDKYYPKGTKSYLSYQLNVLKADGDVMQYTERDVRSFLVDSHVKDSSLYFKSKKSAKKYIKEFKKKMLEKGDKVESEVINFIKQPQASFVLMEQATGKVRAIVGGRGEKKANRTLNRATYSKRQPGSTFKVLSTYLPALDTCGMTLADVMDDAPFRYPGTNKKVRDWDSSGYKGLTSLRQGIYDSVNVVTVKTFQKVTPQTGFDYLLNLGFTTLVDKRESSDGKVYTDIQLPTALGGLTDGVTNIELTAAYAAIANGGKYIKPVYYTKIVDSKGDVLLKNKSTGKRIMKESTSWLLTDAMKDVISKGTGKKAAFKKLKMSQVGKTGTTSNNTDFWFEGYTPYYTAGIWMGYDSMFNQDQGSTHKLMWSAIMEKVHKYKRLKNKNFKMPTDIVTRNICTKCGKLAVAGLCDEALDGNDTRMEYFAKGTQPKDNCDCHVKYLYSGTTGKLLDNASYKDANAKVYLKKDESAYNEQTKDTPYLIPGTTNN
ncbi:transglycosylase domain-containing protein [Eubacterium sp. MSJ-13]|uniref:transglycosylase domain-containing protein n=1 Tax=Eubacterium sp. MSJ-13 TaxID=2841513 RepID=UPI001C10995A|nr:transglycosylase domain-containing protein [Eubacterium sp. MSJ-13]MBU5478725.1 transglycosylase domain-containing protein [Eubacterium sp. MSJ-13]